MGSCKLKFRDASAAQHSATDAANFLQQASHPAKGAEGRLFSACVAEREKEKRRQAVVVVVVVVHCVLPAVWQ
jgi:hypothetical protein